MKLTWQHLKDLQLPISGVAAAIVMVVGVTWAAFSWADNIADTQLKTATAQLKTQGQLDQLILIVGTSTVKNSETHVELDDGIEQVERDFELLRQEVELRRELEAAADGN